MKRIRSWSWAAAAALLLAACGGGGDGDQSPRVAYGKMVSFGDSLSDVGSYATPGLVASTGGGKYTVNSAGAKIWIERLAAQVGVPAPCASQTGLEADPRGPFAAFAAPITNHAGCYAYGQGGSRVTNPVGPWNKALIPNPTGYLGQITDPVLNQIGRHLAAAGGVFKADDLVLVSAGPNDLFINIATLQATIGGGGDPTAAATAAVTAMGVAGGELAAYVKNLIVAKGAKHVVVLNLGDASLTPEALLFDAATRGLILAMVQTFNAQLAAGLAGTDNEVLQVDLFTQVQRWAAAPAQYGISNMTANACDATKASQSLVCTAATTVAADVSRYFWADSGGHATPYGYQLTAQFVATEMIKRGWL